MSTREKKYGVIAEWRDEAPLVMETIPLDYFKARARAEDFLKSPRVIRVAVFEMRHAWGNKTMLPETENTENEELF